MTLSRSRWFLALLILLSAAPLSVYAVGDTLSDDALAGQRQLQQVIRRDGVQDPNASAPADNAPQITPVVPRLSVPIPGVNFTPPAVEGDEVSVPFLAQYISGIYGYLLGISTIIGIIVVVVGGFYYLLGATVGDTRKGQTLIQDAVGGLVVLYASYFILYTINPNLVNLRPLRLSAIRSIPISEDAGSDSAARDLVEGAPQGAPQRGPSSFCRENLQYTPRQPPRRAVWCAACGGCRVISTGIPDNACLALIGPQGGGFGQFLDALTGNCRGKTFGWLETLDGGTFGILHYTENEFAPLMQRLQRKDPAAYARAVAAGGGNPAISNAAICESNRTDRGFVCNQGYKNMLVAALRERSFTLVQLEDAYNRYISRTQNAASHGFRSAYGQAMWATVVNNPGSCGGGFPRVLAACSRFTGNDEQQKIDCFLEQYVAQGCRDGYPGNARRVQSIRTNLQGVSTTAPPQTPSLQQLESLIP